MGACFPFMLCMLVWFVGYLFHACTDECITYMSMCQYTCVSSYTDNWVCLGFYGLVCAWNHPFVFFTEACFWCMHLCLHVRKYVCVDLSGYFRTNMSIYVSTCLPNFSLILSIYVYIYLCISLSIYLSTYLSNYLPIYPSTYLPICRSTYLSTYLPIYLSI